MAQKKKLQVFVSSTYTDLRDERQAAVEAILTAGHIPAGMELFAAGDETQMNVIKRWIDESDVYLLILGGRYGTLEQNSQKSYIHLEYDYAVEQGKPLFAVVIEEDYSKERVRSHSLGAGVIETENPQKLKEFRAQVLTKMVKFWRDPKDIKLAIMETMADFSRREDLKGWIPGDEAFNTGAVAEEIARLGKENAELRTELANQASASATYNGVTFEQLYRLLAQTSIEINDEDVENVVGKVAEIFGDSAPGLLHMIWVMREIFRGKWISNEDTSLVKAAEKAEEFGLVHRRSMDGTNFSLTESGKQFLLRLRLERDTGKAETHIIDYS